METKPTIIITLVFSLSLIVASYLIANGHFNIRTTQTSVTKDGTMTNTINVSGDGTAVSDPDLVNLGFEISEKASSTKIAQQNLNKKVNEVLSIAKKYSVKDEKIKTTNFYVYPNYEWISNSYVLKGYSASQSLNIEIKYAKNDERATNIIDEVSVIGGVKVTGINFDYENKTELANKAREQAYKSAEEKAMQLANLSGVKLGKPVSIVDNSMQFNQTNSYAREMSVTMDYKSGVANSAPALPSGQLEHKMNISVVFAIE